MNIQNLMTTKEFALRVNSYPDQIQYYVRTGLIGHLGKKGSVRLFDEQDVIAFQNRVDHRVSHGRRRKKIDRSGKKL